MQYCSCLHYHANKACGCCYSFKIHLNVFSTVAPNTPGQDGEVDTSAVTSGAIDVAIKESYPMALLQVMKRQAEDVLLVDPSDAAGRAALTFIHSVSSQKSEPGAAEFAKGTDTP